MKANEILKENSGIDEDVIHRFMAKIGISNYAIQDDGSVDVDGDIHIADLDIQELPVSFNYIDGKFIMQRMPLTTLKGCPHTVTQGCRLEDLPHITNLDFCPSSISTFVINNLPITTLVGGPEEYVNRYTISNTQITSLDGLPAGLDKLNLWDNKELVSLVNGPTTVKNMEISGSPKLKSLKGLPKLVTESFIIRGVSMPVYEYRYALYSQIKDFDCTFGEIRQIISHYGFDGSNKAQVLKGQQLLKNLYNVW